MDNQEKIKYLDLKQQEIKAKINEIDEKRQDNYKKLMLSKELEVKDLIRK